MDNILKTRNDTIKRWLKENKKAKYHVVFNYCKEGHNAIEEILSHYFDFEDDNVSDIMETLIENGSAVIISYKDADIALSVISHLNSILNDTYDGPKFISLIKEGDLI